MVDVVSSTPKKFATSFGQNKIGEKKTGWKPAPSRGNRGGGGREDHHIITVPGEKLYAVKTFIIVYSIHQILRDIEQTIKGNYKLTEIL